MNHKKEVIEKLFKKGILTNPDILEKEVDSLVLDKIDSESDLLVLNEDYAEVLVEQNSLVDWQEIDRFRVEAEKERDDDLYQTQLQHFKKSTLTVPKSSLKQEVSSLEVELKYEGGKEDPKTENTNEINLLSSPKDINQPDSAVTIVLSHQNIPHKYTINDFTNFFISRYRFLENILRHRQELQHPLTINRVLAKKEKEKVSVIGLVVDISETKAGNIIVTLEDLTGRIKILFSKNKPNLVKEAKDLVPDEVVGVSGVCGDKIIFAETLLWPDLPQNRELKKGPEEEYAIFLSDFHVGSEVFLKEEFNKFLLWINGKIGNEKQQEIARKVKYIFIAGDLVDGVGIYPSQEEELEIKEINQQYEEFCRLIKEIPLDKRIIVCPGNHDVVHLAEPQSVFYEEFSSILFKLPNITIVTNPALVNIGKTEHFSGFDVLMYHGFSFDYYINRVESIRTKGGYHRADLVMKFLLKRRHLAPSFGSTPYFPAHREDPLLIKKIPDFFITGHIHYSCVANYKGVTMISGSCWQGKTSFQEKLGHEPEPARVPLINLKTREIKILKFI